MSTLIPNRLARASFLDLQGLGAAPGRSVSDGDVAALIHQLGFVQVDSINTVARAHHHILFSRRQTYRPVQLHRLVERDGVLFENWTHDAAVIPSAFFRYWRHRFAREKARLHQRWEKWRDPAYHGELDAVLKRIEAEGPLMTRDFEGRAGASTGWWDWHPSKTALEYLWRTGDLAIARRDGFQKVYDLTERVVPEADRLAKVDRETFVDWACRSALERLGFATRGEIAAFWWLLSPAEVGEWMTRNGDGLVPVAVEGVGGRGTREAFALPETLDRLSDTPEPPGRLRILSPFDPVLRDRARAERLFGFRYRIEVFVPEHKREYGYYVFPVLRGDRLVGRIDMRADRRTDRLIVRRFWPEKGVRDSAAFSRALESELVRMARLAKVADITFEPEWRGRT
ncbi:winged helix-turn-helix domain-containing protein [Pararhizobium mangrovi]|uniref:Winged helix-turn-helix domain-containing protein n=1 Tax=Pararhizobium mangrovi TaxID=2590452 RepID=A0A506U533_9HYPH|nr:crosslink repair DNA glycosylase YcaQ family protein [Pararhizobium mangrovi]TPW27027.1 winged helix-turn-helix domain-containing protein [Pararhizobium mangrovi]